MAAFTGDGLGFVIYDKDGVFQRQLSGLDATADISPNVVPTATLILDDDHDALPVVTADGARAGVWFRGAERFRGRISQTPGTGPVGQVTATVEGDLRKVLRDWLMWPVAGAGLDAQTSEYHSVTGPSETVFKTILVANVTRLGVPWTVAPDQGRGSTVTGSVRFHTLADRIVPFLDADNLSIVLTYPEGGGVVVDVREPDTVPGVLTIESGVPDSYAFNKIAPSATRAIVGGRGEGVEREFKQVTDTARETAWGDIIEVFVDARNTDEGVDITPDAQEAVDEGAPAASVSTELVETDRFMYGTTYEVGDLVHVRLGPVETTERISVAITETADEGVVVTPSIGDLDTTDDPDVQLAVQVARLAKGVRDQGRR